MTAAALFNQLKAGKISKKQFLYEVRRDQNLPFISPLTTFKEAIQILQNKRIISEVFEMGSMEESKECPCGGTYEAHEDAGELVCNSCGERAPDKEIEDSSYEEPEQGDEEFEDLLAKHDAEKTGEEEVLSQFDLEENEEDEKDEDTPPDDVYIAGEEDEHTPPDDRISLRELVQEFVKNAVKGGSSMDEAKQQAREYFSKKENLNEAVKPKLTVDQVNPYEFKKGVNIEMGVDKSPAPDWSSYLGNLAGDIQKAQAKVLKNLAKDPAYYSNMIAGKAKEKKAPVVKADGYVKLAKSKMEKSNVKTTLSKTEKAKGNPKGVKMMKEDAFAKIKEYVNKSLKKETQLIKSKKTGTTIDVVPDGQANQIATDLQKKGVQITKTSV